MGACSRACMRPGLCALPCKHARVSCHCCLATLRRHPPLPPTLPHFYPSPPPPPDPLVPAVVGLLCRAFHSQQQSSKKGSFIDLHLKPCHTTSHPLTPSLLPPSSTPSGLLVYQVAAVVSAGTVVTYSSNRRVMSMVTNTDPDLNELIGVCYGACAACVACLAMGRGSDVC